MTAPEKRLSELGLTLPQIAPAAANYVPYVIAGDVLYVAGQIPFLNGEKMHIGRLGDGISVEQGQEAARACALNILAQVKDAIAGDWNHLVRCVKLGGFVNATPEFDQHPAVINGASDLMVSALGEKGRHARFAVGANNLPFGVSVEIDAIFQIRV
ncbi:MAG: RidA family protein [Pseudobdellovibrionaceae bacterium]|jgi:enamine deaminase RidA (YjgF/YER057c/UK114 family)|nr:RidA family protein [Pseudobdellovibrionaceae bacterium]